MDLANPNGEILPGAYAQVHLQRARSRTAAMLVPASALLFRAGGTSRRDGRRRETAWCSLPVTLGRDFGTQVEVIAGLKLTGDRVIDSPPDAILEGQTVRIAAPARTSAAAAPPAMHPAEGR